MRSIYTQANISAPKFIHSPYNTLKVVCKFEVGSLNLHYLSGKESLFKTGKGLHYRKLLCIILSFFTPPMQQTCVSVKSFVQLRVPIFLLSGKGISVQKLCDG